MRAAETLRMAVNQSITDLSTAPLLLTHAECAQVLRCSKRTVRRLVASGTLGEVRAAGMNPRVPRAELERFITENSRRTGAGE
jgi:excisionase family DNA binding protein